MSIYTHGRWPWAAAALVGPAWSLALANAERLRKDHEDRLPFTPLMRESGIAEVDTAYDVQDAYVRRLLAREGAAPLVRLRDDDVVTPWAVATRTVASQSATMYPASSAVRCQLIGVT